MNGRRSRALRTEIYQKSQGFTTKSREYFIDKKGTITSDDKRRQYQRLKKLYAEGKVSIKK